MNLIRITGGLMVQFAWVSDVAFFQPQPHTLGAVVWTLVPKSRPDIQTDISAGCQLSSLVKGQSWCSMSRKWTLTLGGGTRWRVDFREGTSACETVSQIVLDMCVCVCSWCHTHRHVHISVATVTLKVSDSGLKGPESLSQHICAGYNTSLGKFTKGEEDIQPKMSFQNIYLYFLI